MSNLLATLQNSSTWGDRTPIVLVKGCDQRLCDACRTGDFNAAQEAISQGADVNVSFRLALGEMTPIMIVSKYGHINIAELLLEKRVDIKRKIDFDGTTCLHNAAASNQYEMAKFLIQHGIDVNITDKLGRTPLMDAAEMGHEKNDSIFY